MDRVLANLELHIFDKTKRLSSPLISLTWTSSEVGWMVLKDNNGCVMWVTYMLLNAKIIKYNLLIQMYKYLRVIKRWAMFTRKNKKEMSCNHFHNILRLFDVLPNFPFTTSEIMRDYYF